MQFAYLMLEWCTPATGTDVVLAAVAENRHAVPETVHPLLGLSSSSDGVAEAEVHFTVGIADGSNALTELCDEIRSRGFRVKTGMVIPAEIARTDANTVFAFESAEADRCYAEYLACSDS